MNNEDKQAMIETLLLRIVYTLAAIVVVLDVIYWRP